MYMYVVVPQDGDTALLCACWHGFQPIVECLVESGSSLWIRNKDGDTAVHVAAVRGYYTIVRFLCESGADIDAVNQVCTLYVIDVHVLNTCIYDHDYNIIEKMALHVHTNSSIFDLSCSTCSSSEESGALG